MVSRHLARLLLLLALLGAASLARRADAQWPADGRAVCTAPNDQLRPVSCADGSGGAIIAWVDSRGGPYTFDIYAQRVNKAGTPMWAAGGVPLCTATGNQQLPVIASDGAGGVIVAWEDNRASATAPDIYAQRLNANGGAQWTPDGVAVCSRADEQVTPTIAPDGSGGAVIAWADYRHLSGDSLIDIYGQRVNASGQVQWAPDGVPICTALEDQSDPVAASDGAGGAIIAWNDNRNFLFNIHAQRVDGTGSGVWTPDGISLSSSMGDEVVSAIVPDGAGGVVVVWEELLDFDFDIYAQRVSSSGSLQWGAGAAAVCTASLDQLVPVVISDGGGGAIVTWEDSRAGQNDIYAQRVNASGSKVWNPQTGVAVCAAVGDQDRPRLVSDGSGGAIIAWHDYRTSTANADVYAQRLSSSGAAQWSANGVAVCPAASDQILPSPTADGAGGAILAWADDRSGTSSDIYAQRVTSAGAVAPTVGVSGPTASGIRLSSPWPNPARDGTVVGLTLPARQTVSAAVFDMEGRLVCTLSRDQELPAGVHSLSWDGRGERGELVSSGVYLLSVRAGAFAGSSKVIVAR